MTTQAPTEELRVRKRYSWHMGHRLPDHDGLCRNLHGHTYHFEVEVARPFGQHESGPQRGMLVDFAVVSEVVQQHVVKPLDHVFLVWREDPVLMEMAKLGFAQTPPLKFLELDFTTTAENICRWLAHMVAEGLKARDRELVLRRAELWETPTSSAIWLQSSA